MPRPAGRRPMTRTIEVDRVIGGDEREKARVMIFAAAADRPSGSGRLSIRQLDRISALSGIPWGDVTREARKEGLTT